MAQETPSTSQSTINIVISQLQRIGVIRDGLLVIVSLLYMLGYIVWSINSAINNFGLLPALDSQYFVAGAIPFLIFVMVYFAIRIIKFWRKSLSKWFETKPGSKSRLTVRILFACYFAMPICLVMITHQYYWTYLAFPIYLFMDFIFLQHNKSAQRFGMFSTYFIPLLLGIYGVIFYVFVFYPIIPQELGGIRPRCAYLDVVTDQLSSDVSQVLIPNMQASHFHVSHSIQVDVLYSNNEFLLVKPAMHQSSTQESMIYEIRRDILQAISWCGQGGK
jgi:hypothetical protein